jgi:hypothetical protein
MDHPVTSDDAAESLRHRLSFRHQILLSAAGWINQHEPSMRGRILAAADQAIEGRIPIDGSEGKPFFIGNPPAWKEIRTADNHYGCTLNRMPHWSALLQAYLLTGDLRYARKAADEAENWIDSCPRPPLPGNHAERLTFYGMAGEIVPWHCLNSAIRLFESWRRMLETLSGTEALPPDLLGKIARSMREQAEAIRAVSPYLFPEAKHNHYLMEMLGVLSYARLFPEMPEAADWARHAAGELSRCALAQLEPAGAQSEGCPSYHNGCMYWFCLARQFAADCGHPLDEEADRRIRNGIRHAVYATRPFGEDVPWGDSHPAQGFVASALWAGISFDDWEPLAQTLRFTAREKVRQACLDSIWDIGDMERLLARIASPSFPASFGAWPRIEWQKEVKQVSLRTGWTPNALGVFFACHTPVHYGNHGHADPNGFEFSAQGRVLLADPGCCAYYESETRRRVKSAACHNTLTVNFREPFEYCSSFAYSPQKEGGIDWVKDEPLLLAAQGTHRNYEPAVHRRAVALVDDRFLLVLDELTDLYWLSSVQLNYQLPFEQVVRRQDGGGVASQGGAWNVFLVTSVNMSCRVPPQRFGPDPAAGFNHGFTTVRFDDWGASHQTHRGYATLIVPWKQSQPAPLLNDLRMDESDSGWRCSFQLSAKDYAFEWSASALRRPPHAEQPEETRL